MFSKVSFPALSILIFVICACGAKENNIVDDLADESAKSYLTEVVPPCLATESEPDPCPVDLPALQNTGSALSRSRFEVPTFTDLLLYDSVYDGVISVHIVIRGIVKKGTTRCEIYRFKLPSDMAEFFQRVGGMPLDGQYIIGRYQFTCFADVAVKEYIVGEGPPTLPLITKFEVLFEDDFNDQGEIEEKYLDFYGDPEKKALDYEGREIIFFLGPPPSITVEAWVALGGYNKWFLQQTDQGIRAISRIIRRAFTDEMRSKLNLPLDEMIADIKQAAINRETITGGQIGLGPDMPILITDAHNLRDYYISVGAVYDDTENTTFLPPPAPGEGDPPAPTLPVNDDTTGTTIPVPGEEETAPPATDDAGLSVGQTSTTTTETTTTSSTTTTTLVSSTTEAIPADTVTTTTEVTETTTTTSAVTETVTGTTTTTTEAPNEESDPPPVDDITSEEEQTTTTTSTPPAGDDPPPTETVSPIEEPTPTTTPPASDDIPADTTDIPLPSDDDIAPPANEGEPADEPGADGLPADGAGV